MVHLWYKTRLCLPPHMKLTGLQQAEAIKPLKQIFAIQRVVAPVGLFFFLPLLLSCQVNSIVSRLDSHSILCFTAICPSWSIHQFCQPQRFMVAISSQSLGDSDDHSNGSKHRQNTSSNLETTWKGSWKPCIIQALLKHTLETSECSLEIHTLRSRHQPVPSLGPPKARYWKEYASCWNN